MIDKALVPPNTAGWMVRVGTPSAKEEFFMVALADESAAVAAVAAHVGGNETVEGVATMSAKELAQHALKAGQIKQA